MVDLKALVPWRDKSPTPAPRDDVFDPFVSFRRELDRMFDQLFDGFAGRTLQSPFAFSRDATPSMDLIDNDKEIVVTAELPGLDDKDFEVTVAGDVLTVKGEKRSEHEHVNGNAHYAERRYGAFARSVRLPFEIKDQTLDAKYHNGVLTVRVPKPAGMQREARRISVTKV